MNNISQPEPTELIYNAPAIKVIRISSSQSILTGSNEDSVNSIQEYELEQGEW